jgi:hypothetical protein
MHFSGLPKGLLVCWTYSAIIIGVVDYDVKYHAKLKHTIDHYYFNLLLPELIEASPSKAEEVVMRCTLFEK